MNNGICVWLTGLSGSGKSTTAVELQSVFHNMGRTTTLLDGDLVRNNLSKGLGFSKEDRDINILRIGFVAAEIVRHGGVVICAAISPYQETRKQVRQMVGAGFFEVFVNTPLEECERRDVKGLYDRARKGEIKGFTGIDDPYEVPTAPELEIDTIQSTSAVNSMRIVDKLHAQGMID